MSLSRSLFHHARNRPTHPALVDGGAILDYRELWTRVAGAAAELRRRGLEPGDVVALVHPAGVRYVLALQALVLAGGVVLPIHPSWPAAHRSELLRFFGARAVFASDPDPAAELHLTPDALDARAPDAPLPRETWEAPLVVSNSSGTTDAYKGALLTHAQMLSRVHARTTALGLSPHDRLLFVVEPHHAGSRNACFAGLHAGATLLLRSDLASPKALVQAAAEERATFTYLVPSMLRALLGASSLPRPALPSLRSLFASSDRLSTEERRLIRERLSPHLYEGYGTSEAGLITLSSPEDQLRHEGAVGRPVLDVTMEIVDDEARVLPRGELGNVRVRGPGVSAAYFKNPTATAARFRNGWFYPGDLATQNEEGYVFLKGRVDDTIVREGMKFLPADVEKVLLEHPSVAEVAVVGIPLASGSAWVVAFVVARGPATEAELLAHAVQRLPAERRPNGVSFLDALPVTELGKIHRVVLLARARELMAARSAQLPDRS